MKKTKWHFVWIISLFIILLLPDVGQAENAELRVTVSKANIRSKPTTASEVLTQVTMDTILNSDLQEGNWYRVILPPDDKGVVRIGYIHNSIVEKVEAQKEPVKEAPEIIEKVEDVVEKPEGISYKPQGSAALLVIVTACGSATASHDGRFT